MGPLEEYYTKLWGLDDKKRDKEDQPKVSNSNKTKEEVMREMQKKHLEKLRDL
ncbi:MAG: hypothetical protein LBT04_00220 [Prevotellaceae bacterium]|jgi:hypothetical protein|nr:hypothetical protein [Prevotellaceae bacterium]